MVYTHVSFPAHEGTNQQEEEVIEVFSPGPSPSWTLPERAKEAKGQTWQDVSPLWQRAAEAGMAPGFGSTRLGQRSGGQAAGPDGDLRGAAAGGQRPSEDEDNVPQSRLG